MIIHNIILARTVDNEDEDENDVDIAEGGGRTPLHQDKEGGGGYIPLHQDARYGAKGDATHVTNLT